MRAAGERCMVVEAEVAAAFVVVEAELALQLPVVELDRPAQAREPGETLARLVLAQVREPVVARRLGRRRPFDDQPLPARRLVAVPDRVGSDDAGEREATLHLLPGRARSAAQPLPGAA